MQAWDAHLLWNPHRHLLWDVARLKLSVGVFSQYIKEPSASVIYMLPKEIGVQTLQEAI